MKMRNEDLKKITEIKQYLLDPPVSFKLYGYAIVYLQDALNILSVYKNAEDAIIYLQHLLQQLQNKTVPQEELRGVLKEAGRKISSLTSA
jgi:hypothetical protein